MKLLCLAALISFASASGVGYGGPSYAGGTAAFDDLVQLVEDLEGQLVDLNNAISAATTLAAAGDERINFIVDFFLSSIRVNNSQQYALTVNYEAQINDLIRLVNEARAKERRVLNLAQSTAEALHVQQGILDEESNINDEQDAKIAELKTLLAECNEIFLGNLNFTLDNLDHLLETHESAISIITDFVGNRQCEYGFGAFTPGEKVFIPFKTTFYLPPDGVALALAGFVAHLDVHSYDDYDGLALDKYVGEVTQSGFYIDTRDLSDGMVDVNRIYCSWMACAGLYDNLSTEG